MLVSSPTVFLPYCLTLIFPFCLSHSCIPSLFYFFTLSIFFPVCLTFISSLFISFLFTFLPTSLNFILLCLSDFKCFHPSHSHFLSLSVSLFSPSLFSFPVCLTRVSSSFSLVFLHHVYLILMSFLSISLHFFFPTISLFFSFSACLTSSFPIFLCFPPSLPPSLLSHSYFPSLSLSSSLSFLLRFISLSTCLSYSLPPSLCFLLSHFLPHPTLIFPLSISLHLYLLISLSSCCHFPPLWLSHSHFPSLSASLLFSPRLSPTPSRFLFLFLSVSLFNSLSFSLPARLTLSFPSLSLRLCRPHWAHHWCV